MNNKFIILAFAVTISIVSSAQSVKTKNETARIKNENIDGHAVDVDGNGTDVNTALIKYLKTFGRVKTVDCIVLSDPLFDGKNYTASVYATTKENGKTTQAWIGIKSTEWPEGDVKHVNDKLDKIIYDFGVQFYKDKIQVQIDETNEALQAVDRQQQKLTSQNHDLATRLENNKREKLRLEKAIENNKLQYENLLKRIDKNKKDQDSVALADVQIKKVLELHKARQLDVK